MKWYLIIVLICISLTISNVVKHIFMCLLATCMSSLEKCHFRFLSTFWLGFLKYWAAWALCIFWRLISCWLHHLQIFTPSQYVVFLFMVSIAVPKLSSLIRSHLFLFPLLQEMESRSYCCDWCVLSMFSSISIIVSDLKFRYLISFEFIFACGVKEWSNFIFFYM